MRFIIFIPSIIALALLIYLHEFYSPVDVSDFSAASQEVQAKIKAKQVCDIYDGLIVWKSKDTEFTKADLIRIQSCLEKTSSNQIKELTSKVN